MRRCCFKRILTDVPIGYVDLRSPAGIGLGALVYNYDGKVFASDEGRMLAEMGDRTFELGDLATDDYRSLILSDKLIETSRRLALAMLARMRVVCVRAVLRLRSRLSPCHPGRSGRHQALVRSFVRARNRSFELLIELLEDSPEDAAILRGGYLDDAAAAVGDREVGHGSISVRSSSHEASRGRDGCGQMMLIWRLSGTTATSPLPAIGASQRR